MIQYQVSYRYEGCKTINSMGQPALAIAGIRRSRAKAEALIALMRVMTTQPIAEVRISEIRYGEKKEKKREFEDFDDNE